MALKRTELLRKSPLKAATKGLRRSPFKPGDGARRNGVGVPKRSSFAASPAQQEKVRWLTCAVCGADSPDPAHLIARGVTTVDQDDALAVIPLCRFHHDEYDQSRTLDLLPFLEPRFREELAFAVKRIGLVSTFRRVTNDRYAGENRLEMERY